jgi:hypothetical protein
MGRLMSLSVRPMDLSMARAGARDEPSVMIELRVLSLDVILGSLGKLVV